jgi:flagellar hook-length control protein FliK
MQFLPITHTFMERPVSGDPMDPQKGSNAGVAPFGSMLGKDIAALDASNAAGQKGRPEPMGRIATLKVSREDFATLKEDFILAGFSAKDILELQYHVESQVGMTWAQLLEGVSKLPQSNGRQDLSLEHKRDLFVLFHSLGFTPQDAERLLHLVETGDAAKVLDEVSALVATGQKEHFSLDKGGLLLLVDRTSRSTQESLQLRGMVEAFSSDGEVSRDGLIAILAQMRQFQIPAGRVHSAAVQGHSTKRSLQSADQIHTAAEQGRGPALDELAERIAPVIRQALEGQRARGLSAEDSRSRTGPPEMQQARDNDNAKNQHARDVLAERVALMLKGAPVPSGVLHHTGGVGGNPSSGDAGHIGRRLKPGTAPSQLTTPIIGVQPVADTAITAVRSSREPGERMLEAFRKGGKKGGAEETSGNDWARLWEKVRTESDVRENIFGGQSRPDSSAGQKGEGRVQPRYVPESPSRAVFDQVQSGMLRTLGNGARQLTLQLTPPDLGQVQLLLQVHNKELSAVIKTGNHEVSRIVTEQIAHLRETLEQQGFRVTRLEVQTQSENQFANTWQGAERHNEAWEQLRRRSLGHRNADGRSNGDRPPGPEVPHPGQQKSEGLDIFA